MPERVFVLAPGGRDATVVVDQLGLSGIDAKATSAEALVEAIRDCTLGTAIVTVEALETIDIEPLRAALLAQPPWSDCPIVLLTRRDSVPSGASNVIIELGNVSQLERPLHPNSLVTAVRTSLRARARQRRSAAYLRAHEEAEAEVRRLADTLEARVVERTAELTHEIAMRVSAEERLRASEELYRYTIDLSAQIPWSMAADGTPLSVGERWLTLTGLTREQFEADGWRIAVHPDDRAANDAGRAAAAATRSSYDLEFRLKFRDGSYRWCRTRGSPRLDEAGNVLGWYGTFEDIHERRLADARNQQLQSELIHVSRLSAMGTMASTLAHELNQPLTAIANYVRGMRRMLAAGTPDKLPLILGAIEAVDTSAIRAGEIVRRLRELVARGEVAKQPESLPELIREASAIAMIDSTTLGVDFHVELDPLATRVAADRIQVQQVLINLLRNAVEAMEPMAVRRIDVATHQMGELCEISVSDTGPGVSPAVAARLFEPFNTSKPDGMGIGLSISRTIIEAHGGQIWYQPAPGGGAKFTLTLPSA